jgi:hypothetical protein
VFARCREGIPALRDHANRAAGERDDDRRAEKRTGVGDWGLGIGVNGERRLG